MKSRKYTGFIIGGILVVIVIYVISVFNSLVKKEEKVNLQANEVQNAYQRRLDLIPNLVNVVKGISDFEQTTLVKITEARSKAATVSFSEGNVSAATFNKATAAHDELAVATNNLIIVIEKYPTLKGTAAYSGLQTQLEGTERRIKVARKDFNAAINDYNSSVRTFPAKLFVGILGFDEKTGFTADSGTEKTIEIKF